MDVLANNHQRKRSFDLANEFQYYSSTVRRCVRHGSGSSASSISSIDPYTQLTAPLPKRRPPLQPTKYSNMHPADAASVLSTPFPSFMSVVGKPDASLLRDMEELVGMRDSIPEDESQILVTDAKPPPDHEQSTLSLHHRDSVNSMTTTSTESSPTTTNSTFDSPCITDSSPSSSPESASSNAPVSPFRNATMNAMAGYGHAPPQQRMPPPPEKPQPTSIPPNAVADTTKNVKNLSLNMNAVSLPRPATSSGFESHAFSAPTSPLKDTPRTGRKKPNNLTIRTPGFQQLTFNRGLDVPPTPSSRPILHHMASSPALASLASPKKPPPGGLFLNLPAIGTSGSGQDSDSNNLAQSNNIQLPDLREEDESRTSLRSQEVQERGYPNGPVLIYDSGVYLYLEPSSEEAAQFDTVINVAKEVKNPFAYAGPAPLKEEMPEPQTAVSEMSFKSAWEWPQPTSLPTPTTPRPASFVQAKQPEYLHVPWDHNSEILEDLYSLCRLIDDRIQAGKKVLIHCQLGVSRSASLLIAYGLYKGYQPDFHSMYMAVKQRSQWVGPNMSLIYQLTDFRSRVVKGAYGDHTNKPKESWWQSPSTSDAAIETPIVRQCSWERTASDNEKTPVASKAPPHILDRNQSTLKLNKAVPPVPLFPKIDANDAVVTPVKLSQIFGGLAKPSPPSTRTPESITTIQATSPQASSPPMSTSPRPLPFRERFESSPSHSPPIPSRTPKLGLITHSPKMDLATDEPSTPSVFSPRATEFMASPFGITVAGDLAVAPGSGKRPRIGVVMPRNIRPSANFAIPGDQIPVPYDPRSPHQQGEGPEIFRNIDGYL
jgi:tyrosine-protein phosphatase MSG5